MQHSNKTYLNSGYSIIQLPEMLVAFWGFIKNWKQNRILTKQLHEDDKMNTIQNMRMTTNSSEDSTIDVNMIHTIQIQRMMDEHMHKNKSYESILERLDKLESKIKLDEEKEKHSNIITKKKHGILAIK